MFVEKLETDRATNPTPIVLDCPACAKSVAAPPDMIGQLVECPFCKHHFTIEASPDLPARPEKERLVIESELTRLEDQLRENQTQITELRGHVGRLNMELHRHQLRMTKLAERHEELQSGIAAVRLELDENS